MLKPALVNLRAQILLAKVFSDRDCNSKVDNISRNQDPSSARSPILVSGFSLSRLSDQMSANGLVLVLSGPR